MIKLSKKDRKILWELEQNARQPTSLIAKNTSMSQQVVDYRIKRMEKKGIISGYHTIVSFSKFGFMYCRILIKLRKANEDAIKKMFVALKKKEKSVWISRCHGCWDFATVFMVKTVHELNEEFRGIVMEFHKFIEDKEVSIAVRFHNFKHKYVLEETPKYNPFTISGGLVSDNKITPDEINLLQLLAKNARIKVTDISKNLSIPVQTVRSKIIKFEKDGIIQEYKPTINHKKLGLHYYHVFLYLDDFTKVREKQIFTFLQNSKEVIHVTFPLGGADMEFDILISDDYHLTGFVNKLITEFPDSIRDYKFMLFSDIQDMRFFLKQVA